MFSFMRSQESRSVWLAIATAIILSPPAIANTSSQSPVSQGESQRNAQRTSQQTPRPSPRRPQPPRRVRPPSPPPRSLPPNRVRPGGGLETLEQACHSEGTPLTALLPIANPVYTATAHPTFLFYLPTTSPATDYVEFILLSADEKQQIYAAQFVPHQSGIVSLSLPTETRYALEKGTTYRWHLNLHCQNIEAAISVGGQVRRSSDDQTANLQQISGEGSLTDENIPEIWYDSLARVAAALANGERPSSAQHYWESWLTAIGLEDIINAPIISPPIESSNSSKPVAH